MTDIVWTRLELQKMLSKKIWAWINRNLPLYSEANLSFDRDSEKLIELAFARRVRWGKAMVPPFQPVNILSAGRPRWMAQLCRMAGEQAESRNSKIQAPDINAVMPDFARYRLNDLIKEHKHQFDKLEQLVHTFSNAKSRYTLEELCKMILNRFVLKVGVPNIGKINEEVYKSPVQLIELLFQAGYLVARYGHDNDSRNAEFRTFTDEPELLRYGKPNREDLFFEIYPSYRIKKKTTRRRIV